MILVEFDLDLHYEKAQVEGQMVLRNGKNAFFNFSFKQNDFLYFLDEEGKTLDELKKEKVIKEDDWDEIYDAIFSFLPELKQWERKLALNEDY